MSNKGKAGSQLDLQLAVESYKELSSLILKEYPQGSSIKWYSPIKETGYKEFVDRSFWDGYLKDESNSFWDGMKKPSSFWVKGGPNWDGLGVVTEPDGKKVLILIEAKAHKGEMTSTCGACANSLFTINEQLDKAKRLLGSTTSNPWSRKFYQNANRIAYGAILNSIGVNTKVIFILFANDPYWTNSDPTTANDWQEKIQEANEYLGVTEEQLLTHGVSHIIVDLEKPEFSNLKKMIEDRLKNL